MLSEDLFEQSVNFAMQINKSRKGTLYSCGVEMIVSCGYICVERRLDRKFEECFISLQRQFLLRHNSA